MQTCTHPPIAATCMNTRIRIRTFMQRWTHKTQAMNYSYYTHSCLQVANSHVTTSDLLPNIVLSTIKDALCGTGGGGGGEVHHVCTYMRTL